MSRQPVVVTDRSTGMEVQATLDTDVPLVRLVDAEAAWAPYRWEAIRRFLLSGGPLPEHCHWNWASKALRFDRNLHRIFAIELNDQIEGLMWIWLRGYLARLPAALGQPLVYVDYLESAPWSAREYTASPRFKGVGTRLLQAAVLRSREEGFEGRLGLHTLPQSQGFYVEVCGMQALGLDDDYQGLAYLE